MVDLHHPTLFIALAVVALVTAAVVLLAGALAGARRESLWWAAGYCATALSLGLFLQGPAPWGSVLGTGLLCAGLGLVMGGFRAYADLERVAWPAVVLGALGLAGAALGLVWGADPLTPPRVTTLAGLAATAFTAGWLWQAPMRDAQAAARITATGCAGVGLAMAWWLVGTAWSSGAEPLTAWATLAVLACQVVVLAGQMLLLTQRHAAKLAQAAATDSLTGIHNRAGFEELATRKIGRVAASEESLALLVFDIDHFKRINDTHGHPIGDRVLRRVVGRALNTLRPDDLLGRWGGEEFVALLVGVTPEQAYEAAERLRRGIASRGFKLPDGSRLEVTVSVGLMATTANALDPRTQLRKLVAVADVALYEAKRGGRNQVQVGEPHTRPVPLGEAEVSPWVTDARSAVRSG